MVLHHNHQGILTLFSLKEAAFKNQDLEFVSFGHPLFEALMAWVENSFSESMQKGAIKILEEYKN